MLAASGWPKMPKTPHSSLNLSNMVFRPPAARNVDRSPLTRRVPPRPPTDRSTIAPATAIRSRLPPVWPMTRAGTFAAAAWRSTPVTCSGTTETTTRDADSPNSAAARLTAAWLATCTPSSETSAPMPVVSNAHSAIVDRQPAVRAVVRRSHQPLRRRASPAAPAARAPHRDRAPGGMPRTRSCTTLRYSLPPNSPLPSPSSRIASPDSWNRRLTTRSACSSRPTTPIVGVG